MVDFRRNSSLVSSKFMDAVDSSRRTVVRYPLKLIEWRDAHNGDHSWFKAEILPDKIELFIVQTVGFEVQRNDVCVTLAMSCASNGDLCDLFTIPLAVMVREQTFRSRLK